MKSPPRRLLGPVILGLAIAAGLSYGVVKGLIRQEDQYDAEQAVLSRSEDARRLVLVTLESARAEHGRYPAELSRDVVDRPLHYQWFYRASPDGVDYELWCQIPRRDGGVDALVFSPDGAVADDWLRASPSPGIHPSPGGLWTLVQGAEGAPPDRWTHPVDR